MVLDLTGGVTRTVNVNFINNSGLRWATGDFNFDGSITVADYTILATYAETDPTGLSAAEAYRRGDLSGDSLNSLLDFAQFKTIYETANGAGSFAAMLAGVPEPGGLVLLLIAASVGFGSRRLRRSSRIGARIDDLTSYNSVHLPGDRSMPSMRILQRLAVAVSIVATCTSTSQATILEDFSFSEPNGTTLGDAENSANQSNSWSVSANLDNSSVLNGAFRIQKTGTAAAPNYLDIANKTTGKLWLVADIAGWSLNSDTTNLDNFNSAEPEEIRFAFLNNDAPSFGSTLTGQAQFERTSTGGFRLIGNSAGTGSSSVNGTLDLTLDRSDPFTVILEVDVSDMVEQYSVYYRDGAEGSFASLGTAPASLAPNRDANSARFYVNNSFAGDGEHFDVSRIYVTDTSPLTNVVGLSKLSLIVNTSTRDVQIKNESEEAISFDSYRIASNSDSLSFGEWASLSDRNPPLTPFDGPDGGTTPGDSPGELWTKAGGSDDGVVSESFLLSNTILSPENFLDLGKLFKSGGMQDFVFQYHDADTGALFTIDPTYVTFAGVAGDYNQDGTVNAADYTVWRDHLGQAITLPNEDPSTTPGQVTSQDYTVWKSHFGQSAGAGASATAAVPEPASAIVVAVGALAWVLSTARLRQALVHA